MNSESSNTETPTVEQLHEARLKRWHQTGEALHTVENLRSWINAAGLVLFAPRPQVVAPAPTFVEAVLGVANSEPTLQSTTDARGLLARLVAEGVAVPLNLMGTHGTPADTPDFVASAAVFSYIFTLRGDKAWKQPPATSGPVKVSNLALATYQALSSNGPMSAYDLATQLGKEVTETACLRAVNELWTQLRVLPLIQPDGRATVWELTSARFTKQVKSGANAGQPTALSALLSLYLGQAIIASEDEIESFLSPVAPRSRIREVAHALLAARQLDTLVIDGKTLLHVAGEAPSFATPETESAPTEAAGADAQVGEGLGEHVEEGAPRITKYVPTPRKIGTGNLAKGKPAAKRPFERGGERRRAEGFQPRGGGRDERERRPFRKPTGGGTERRFDRPWDEDRTRRKPQDTADFRPPRTTRPADAEQGGERREFRGGSRPPRRDEGRPERRPRREVDRNAGTRPFQNRPERQQRPERDDARHAGGAQERPNFRRFDEPRRPRREQGDRPPARDRRTDFDRKPPRREGQAETRTPRPKGQFESRPNRREGRSDGRPPRREGQFEGRPRRNNQIEGRPRREGQAEGRPPRREGGFAPRSGGKQSGNRPFGKSKFGGGGKFGKSPAKKKPFEKKPSDRTFRPKRDESA